MDPKTYLCHRASHGIRIDGRLDDPSWRAAPWTDPFVDIEGDAKPYPTFRTRAKLLWDDDNLYIGAELEEPHVWATLTERDSVIFHDNDFEVFIDPDGDCHDYFEIEMNALNTVWDLHLPKPYRDGGSARNEWDIEGLRTAVHVDGTINDPTDTDRFWSVEMAIPWKAFHPLAGRRLPPVNGDQWRVNFSRVEWRHEITDGRYRKVSGMKEDNWVWSPQGVVDMHRPETWGVVQFTTAKPGDAIFRHDPDDRVARSLLMRVYHMQIAFRTAKGRWAGSIEELKVPASTIAISDEEADRLSIRLTPDGYRASALSILPDRVRRWTVRQDSRIREDSDPVRS